jgi:cell wall-associated NlpC family hydrolase
MTPATRRALLTAMIGLTAHATLADVSGEDLARCAAIAAPDMRLGCYDALAGRSNRAATRVAPTASSSAKPFAPAIPETPAGAPSATGTAAPPAASAPDDTQNFGLTAAQVHPLVTGPSKIQAHITAVSGSGTVGRPSVVLDNGQTWAFAETAADAQLRQGDLVTIKRASLGSYLLVTAASRSYHVHRLR